LALGIAATTTTFSVGYGVVLRPLPFPAAGRLVRICETNKTVDGFCVASPPNAMDWVRQSRAFETIGLARESWFVIEGADGSEEEVTAGLATAGFLRLFGVTPLLGRILEEADLEPGASRVVVLTYGFWQSRLGGASDVLGQPLSLDSESYTIVGVLAAGLEIPELEAAALWVPLPADYFQEERRGWRGFQAVGRLRGQVSLREASSEITALAARLAQLHPAANEDWGIELTPLLDWVVGGVRPTLLVFFGAGAFVLLIGCTNVANLLLFRVLAREKELAIRAAVGAGRWRLIRLLLVESLAYAALSAVLGLALTYGLVKVFVALAPSSIPRIEEVTIDGIVFGFAALLALFTSLFFGLAPALRAPSPHLSQTLKGAPQKPSGRPAVELRAGLVVFEVALALALLVGAGLLIRSFVAAARWQGGFDYEDLVLVSVLCSQKEYPRAADLGHVYQEVVRQLEALPGVLAAGTTSAGPLFGGTEMEEISLADQPTQESWPARWFDVGPGYFQMLEITLVKGRYFTAEDHAEAPPVALVNQTLARRFWPDQEAVGRRVKTANGRVLEVVGVLADVKPFWPRPHTEPEIYWPNLQRPRWASYLVIRTASGVTGTAEAIRRRLGEVAPGMSFSQVHHMEQIVRRRLVRPRFNMLLLSSFGALALLLAFGGTYAVMSYNVSRRTREIGLRTALGAGPWQIFASVTGEGLRLTALGIGIGSLGAFALTKSLAKMLYDVSPTDPATFSGVIIFLTLASLLACHLPARRASRVDPIEALRSE